MPPLSMMIKPASSACNMRCSYCFYADVTNHRDIVSYGVMKPEVMRRLIRRAFTYADQAISFAFQGGEPTLAGLEFFRSFVENVRQCNGRGLQVNYALQTNGTTLDDAFCSFLAEHHFLTGVSLDGTPEVHNAHRLDAAGNGTYDRVMHGIDLLKKHGADYNILCVVTSRTVQSAEVCWEHLRQHRYLQFIPCIQDFDAGPEQEPLTAEEYGRFLILTFDLYEKAIRQGRPVSERRFDNYMAMLLGQMPELCGMSGVCGMYFLVEADGSVYPCDFYALDDWKMGNVFTDTLKKMESSPASLSFRNASLALPEACPGCRWVQLCRGGCRRDREPFLSTGAPGTNRFCESYRMFFDACYPRMRALAQDIADGRVRIQP